MNGRLQQLVIDTRPLSRRRDLADLHAADQLVRRHSCGTWTFAELPCSTCSPAGVLADPP